MGTILNQKSSGCRASYVDLRKQFCSQWNGMNGRMRVITDRVVSFFRVCGLYILSPWLNRPIRKGFNQMHF